MEKDLDWPMLCWIMTPKAQTKKEKINKLDFMKNFCTSKDTINRVKRQPSKWEKIFVHAISHEGLISKTYKDLL